MPANLVYADLTCPRCGAFGVAEAEADIDGRSLAKDYRVGERVDWLPGQRRPEAQILTGYVVCSICDRDYFVRVEIAADVIQSVLVDANRPGYIR